MVTSPVGIAEVERRRVAVRRRMEAGNCILIVRERERER